MALAPSAVSVVALFFFFNDTATTEIYTLSLHDALPIFSFAESKVLDIGGFYPASLGWTNPTPWNTFRRSEEHTSEIQSQSNLVCRLPLEKKKVRGSDVEHKPVSSNTNMTMDRAIVVDA